MKAGEIKVLSTHAVFEVMGEIGPAFERAHGCRLSTSFDPANAIKQSAHADLPTMRAIFSSHLLLPTV